MSISNQAAQQIAGLLVQGGVPSGHSADIAQRLLFSGGSSSSRFSSSRTWGREEFISIGGGVLRDAFRPPEQPPRDGPAGIAGKDGLPGTAGWEGREGAEGAAGTDGINGQDGYIEEIIKIIGGGGGSGFDPRVLWPLWDAIYKLQQTRIDDSKWRRRVEEILRGQASMLKKLREKDKEIERKIGKIEKDFLEMSGKLSRLETTVEGIESRLREIEKFMPPEECPNSGTTP